METEKEEKKRKRSIRFFMLAILVIIALIEVIIVIVTRGDDTGEYGGQHEDYVGPFVSFENFEYLREMAGDLPIDFTEQLQALILSEYNQADWNESESGVTYTVKVDNSSLTTDVYFPWNICNFRISVSDGRKYEIHLATNGDRLGGFVVKTISAKQNEGKLLLFNVDENSESCDTESQAINKWAENVL